MATHGLTHTCPHLLFNQASGLGLASKRPTYWLSKVVNVWIDERVREAITESSVRELSNEWGTTFLLSESSQQPTGAPLWSRWSRCIRARSARTYRCIDNQFEPTVTREIRHTEVHVSFAGFVVDNWVGKVRTRCCNASVCVRVMVDAVAIPGPKWFHKPFFIWIPVNSKHSVTHSASLSIGIFYKEYCHTQSTGPVLNVKMNFDCECENEILTMTSYQVWPIFEIGFMTTDRQQ